MSVHYPENVRYRPKTDHEQWLIDHAGKRLLATDPYRVKCKKCGKTIRSVNHTNEDGVCKNGN